MATDYRIPRPQSPFLDQRGEPTTEWYNWLKKLDSLFTTGDAGLQAQITQIAYILGSPDGTVANIPPFDQNFLPLDTIVRGEVSLTYSGTLEGGQVILMLVNDSANPGNSHYYGTDALGVKGWHSRALATLSDVDQTAPFNAGDAPVWDGALFQPTAVLANPMTVLGDMITADTGGVPQALPVGADGEVLTVVAGEPAWAAAGSSGARGITVTGGSIGGAVIPAAQVIGGLAASTYTLTGNWYLWCSPSGSIELDVRRTTFGALPPGPGDTICGGNEPAVVGGISASGTFAGWSTGITRDDALSVVVNSVTSVTWFVLLLEAT